ncbi:hypothetical protein RFI_08823, partial [Reticulomyxa filosa]
STQFHNDVNKSSNNSNQQSHSGMLEITQLETLQNEYNAMAKTYAALADIIKQNNSLFQVLCNFLFGLFFFLIKVILFVLNRNQMYFSKSLIN